MHITSAARAVGADPHHLSLGGSYFIAFSCESHADEHDQALANTGVQISLSLSQPHYPWMRYPPLRQIEGVTIRGLKALTAIWKPR